MNRISNTIAISAPIADVYRALATEAGVKAWWTEHCTYDERVGGTATFSFPAYGVKKTAEVTRLVDDKQVTWKITEMKAENQDWLDTTIDFSLERCGEQTVVQFDHTGWRSGAPSYSVCVDGWAYFMTSLKKLLEEGAGTPVVKKAA